VGRKGYIKVEGEGGKKEEGRRVMGRLKEAAMAMTTLKKDIVFGTKFSNSAGFRDLIGNSRSLPSTLVAVMREGKGALGGELELVDDASRMM
jgi:hypothetical protein